MSKRDKRELRRVEVVGRVQVGDLQVVDAVRLMQVSYPKNGSRPRAMNREMVTIVQYEHRKRGCSGSPGG